MKIEKWGTSTFSKSLKHAMHMASLEGAREMVRYIMRELPVYTGRGAGSISVWADYLGLHYAISPVLFSGGRVVPDLVSEGQQMGSIIRLDTPTIEGYEFSTDVYYLAINEIMDVSIFGVKLTRPGPWHIFEEAKKLGDKKMEEELKKRKPRASELIKRESKGSLKWPKLLTH